MKKIRPIIVAVLCVVAALANVAQARQFNDKLQNRPYADLKRWHLGFSVGAHVQDIAFSHNGWTENGETWFMEQPDFQPGFCVNALADLRLNQYFNLRLSPGMYFGNRNIRMVNTSFAPTEEYPTGGTERQSLKTAYVVLPLDIKYSAVRLRNSRPYMTTGIMPAFDVSKKRNDFIRLKNTDLYWTVGFGCDFYLPYFKLIPELKFCFGLTDVLKHDRPDLVDDPAKLKFTNSLRKATSKMIVLSFYFE